MNRTEQNVNDVAGVVAATTREVEKVEQRSKNPRAKSKAGNASSEGTASTRTAQNGAAETPSPRKIKNAIRRVNALLVERYGSRAPRPRDPLDGLVLIILSQATSDVNCERAFDSLKNRFPTWERVLAASTEDVADAIRSGGLANQKAARIREILRQMQDESGALDLSWMHAATTEECAKYLSRFHGVGPKTVACVLVFFLGKAAFPVDTHVHRVSKRLGWIRPVASAEETHRVLEVLVPDECKLDLHVNMISHGRQTCRAFGSGGPRCGECVLQRDCLYFKENGGAKTPIDARASTRFHGTDFFVTVE